MSYNCNFFQRWWEIMDNNNDNKSEMDSKNLLKRAYNCKSDEFESIQGMIDNELEKNRKNQVALTAKLVLTSKMAVKRIESK